MQPINLFFYTYMGYNKVIKGNVYGRYLSGEINTKKTDKEDRCEEQKIKRNENHKEKDVKGDLPNVSTNNHTAVSCVYDH